MLGGRPTGQLSGPVCCWACSHSNRRHLRPPTGSIWHARGGSPSVCILCMHAIASYRSSIKWRCTFVKLRLRLLQTLLGNGARLDLRQAITATAELQPVPVSQGSRDAVFEFVTRRLEQLLVDSGIAVEVARAILAERSEDPLLARTSAQDLQVSPASTQSRQLSQWQSSMACSQGTAALHTAFPSRWQAAWPLFGSPTSMLCRWRWTGRNPDSWRP